MTFPFLPSEDQREMFYGIYERDTVAFLRRWLRPGDVYIDAGANVGYLCAVATDCVGPSGVIHAFEPETAHFARLRRFADLNRDHAITVNACACGDHEGTTELFVSPRAGRHTTVPGFRQSEVGCTDRIPVLMRTLDTYALEHRLEGQRRVRLIKIDVEGAEAAVVRGAVRLIKDLVAEAFFVEVTPPGQDVPTPPVQGIFKAFADAGYQAYCWHRSSHAWRAVRPAVVASQCMVLWTLDPKVEACGST